MMVGNYRISPASLSLRRGPTKQVSHLTVNFQAAESSIAKQKSQQDQTAAGRDVKRLVEQRRRKNECRTILRAVALIAELREPQFSAGKLFGVQVHRHGKPAI